MKKNEKGMTLIEVLATLVLLSLVTGIIWTSISIATKFNVSETSVLKLQQEANYIVSELQRVHRNCYTYELIITTNEVKVINCKSEDESIIPGYDGIISNIYEYEPMRNPTKSNPINTTKENLNIPDFAVIDPIKRIRNISIPISLSRYKTN